MMVPSKPSRARRRIMRAPVVTILVLLAACGPAATPIPDAQSTVVQSPVAASGKIVVVATTTQIRSMTEAVAGDKANVYAMLTPGADPHEFEPKPGDVSTISKSGLVLKNGVGLDDWVDKLIDSAGGSHPLVTVSKGVPLRNGEAGEHDASGAGSEQQSGQDPHIWFSTANAITMTTNIRDALIKVDEVNSGAYKANAEKYVAELKDLDKYIKDQIATLPTENRKIVTNHDAFGYYIDEYGLTFVGSIIPSLSTEAQPSAQDVASLIEKIKTEHVKAIFLESSINPSLARQIGNDAGVKVVDTLYGDTLGEAGSPGAEYIGMMRYNTDTIVAALK